MFEPNAEPEFVKVDTSIIRGIHKDASKMEIVRSIVHVCHKMGKAVIAEGVETLEERDALQHVACDFMQGYFFGRPGPLVDRDNDHQEQRGVA